MKRKHKSAVMYTHTHTHTIKSHYSLRGLFRRCLQWVSCRWFAWAETVNCISATQQSRLSLPTTSIQMARLNGPLPLPTDISDWYNPGKALRYTTTITLAFRATERLLHYITIPTMGPITRAFINPNKISGKAVAVHG